MNEYKYLNIQQLMDTERYPFTYGQLRYLLANRAVNGLDEATRKIGKRLYVRNDLFDQWIENHATTLTEIKDYAPDSEN